MLLNDSCVIFLCQKSKIKKKTKDVTYTKMCKSHAVPGIHVRGCLYRLYNKQEKQKQQKARGRKDRRTTTLQQ